MNNNNIILIFDPITNRFNYGFISSGSQTNYVNFRVSDITIPAALNSFFVPLNTMTYTKYTLYYSSSVPADFSLLKDGIPILSAFLTGITNASPKSGILASPITFDADSVYDIFVDANSITTAGISLTLWA